MQLQGKAMRVTIYIGESDHHQGKALYMALLQLLKQEGASGATVQRGLAGFGANSRIHTASIVDLSTDLPIRLEWVDRPELVERLLPQVQAIVDGGLITVEEVSVLQYAPGRRPDPLTQPIQDVMRRVVITVTPQTPAADIVALLLRRGYRSLPVVDDQNRPQGIITGGDLVRRTELSARLDLHPQLSAGDLQEQLSSVGDQGLTAEKLMTMPLITLPDTASLGQAAAEMSTRELKRLPVVNDQDQLVGWISRVDILRTIHHHRPASEGEPAARPTGVSIAELMYRDVPTVSPDTELEGILVALEKNRRRRAVVIDGDRQVLGIITDGDLLRRTQKEAHPSLLARLGALFTGQPLPAPITLPDVHQSAADLMTAPAATISLDSTLTEALHLMLDLGIKRLPVVDQEGRLVGLLGRATLLRGLLPQE